MKDKAAPDTNPETYIEVSPTVIDNKGKSVGAEFNLGSGPVNIYMKTLPASSTALNVLKPPAALNAFFGREVEQTKAMDELRDRRTVLLHGLAGIGKTV